MLWYCVFLKAAVCRRSVLPLGASEEAAKKRVTRALEKLRKYFAARGVDSTAAAIGETISANSVQVAPAALAKTATAVALAKGAAVSGSTLTLVKGALKIMAWTKAKTAIMVAAPLVLAAGVIAPITIHLVASDSTPSGVGDSSFESFLQHPPAVEYAAFDVIYGSKERDVSITFVEDGTKFLMSQMPTGVVPRHTNGLYFCGQFGDVRWHGGGWGNNGLLMMFDLTLNTNSSVPYGTSQEAIDGNRDMIDQVMHLGIDNMVSGSVLWDQGATNFVANYDRMAPAYAVRKRGGIAISTNSLPTNGQLLVQLSYQHGVPSTALVKFSNRGPFFQYLIKYHYNRDFFGGRLPSEWAIYDPAGERKAYTIRIHTLMLATQPLSLDQFDPRKALSQQWQYIEIWSNNVGYLLDHGKMHRMLDASEAQQN